MSFPLKGLEVSVVRRPLAERMRPSTLGEMIGQEHLLGEKRLLPKLIRENRVGNLILAGPPGTGKTTFGHGYCPRGCELLKVNAVTSNVAELRETQARTLSRFRDVLSLCR